MFRLFKSCSSSHRAESILRLIANAHFTSFRGKSRATRWKNIEAQKLLPGLAVTAGSVAFSFWKSKPTSDNEQDTNEEPKIFTREQVSSHNSVEEGGVWVSYKNKVYDVTEFVEHHPGGDKILLAAGSDVQPFWMLYAFHFEDHVLKILDHYYIGDLHPDDHDSELDVHSGPYADEPSRHPALVRISKQPCNAETPPALIPDHPITPTELFFVRNHLPVPDIDASSHRLTITTPKLSDSREIHVSLDVNQLKTRFPTKSIVSTIVCAGNRRSDMAKEDREQATERGSKPVIRGLGWNHAAISTAKWTGVRLVDLVAHYLCPEDEVPNYAKVMEIAKQAGIRHVQFVGSDMDVLGDVFGASLPIEWALDPAMDVLIAYEMNGEPLPRDHGYPLRAIVPGSVGARQVKWLTGIHLSSAESPSFYQIEDYKMGYPGHDGSPPDYRKLPAIFDYPVQSAICEPEDGHVLVNHGSVTVRGYAFSGGGRGILSVRVSADDGKTWHEAALHPVSPPADMDSNDLADDDLAMEHRNRKQWAWTLWEAKVPIPADAHEVALVCCARDSSNAVQPRSTEANLNVRGLLTNSWHRVTVRLKPN